MAVYKSMKVEIPGKTYKQKNEMKVYVYIYTKFFRKDGKPSNKSVCIGTVCDDDEKKMHPNDTYFNLFGGQGVRAERSVSFFGYTHLAKRILEDLGITGIVMKRFGGDLGKRIITAAVYMVETGSSVMYRIPEWMELKHMPWAGGIVSDRSISDAYRYMGKHPDLIEGTKKDWMALSREEGASYFYDVSSFSFYSQENEIAEYGYNRDGEKLLQINMGLFTSVSTGLPIYYRRYEGSITDKEDMEYAISNMGMLGIRKIKAIMDGGFFKKENVQFLAENTDGFIIGMPSGLKESRKMYGGEDLNSLLRVSNMIGKSGEYGRAVEKEVCGVKGRVIICYNPGMREDFVSSYLEKARLMAERLEGAGKEGKKLHRRLLQAASEFYSLTLAEDGSLDSYELKKDEMDEKFAYSGFFSLFTDDMQASASQILSLYRRKDEDEKCFCQDKVFLGGRRTRVHTLANLDGKLLTQFIALILRRKLLKGLSSVLDATDEMALPKLLKKLDKVGYIVSGDECELLNASSKIVKDSYSALGYDFAKEFEIVRQEALDIGNV